MQTTDGSATLTVSGTLRATYGLLGSTASIQQDSADGTVALTRNGSTTRTPLRQAGPSIAPIGPTGVACTTTTLVLTSARLQFRLTRV